MKKFISKPGYELMIPIGLLFSFFLYRAVEDSDWVEGLLLIIFIGFFIYLLKSTFYTISGKQLEINCGFLYYKMIQIDSIRTIKKSVDIFAAPAMSIHRLIITFNSMDSVAISPVKSENFISELTAINPGIKLI
jgi:hypothetical protein